MDSKARRFTKIARACRNYLVYNVACTPKRRFRYCDLGDFIIIINPVTARVVGAPHTILQPVFSIFPCSLLPSGTSRNSRPVHSLMLSSHFFLCPPCLHPPFTVPCKVVLARPDEWEQDHTSAVCVSFYDHQEVFVWSSCLHRLPRW